jgi:hypothetical protein
LAHEDDICLRLERRAILFERNQHLPMISPAVRL